MKLKYLIPQRQCRQVVRQFGQAQLVKLAGGRHELVGGSLADRMAASEWVSLFAHEIVFSHRWPEAAPSCRSRRKLFPSRLLRAL